MKTANIVWLASYPKSGNTWVRIFLTNYQRGSHEPANINDLDGGPIASARRVFDDFAGVEASDLTPEEIDIYRPGVYIQLAQSEDKLRFIKVHDAYGFNDKGIPLFPYVATRGVIYLIRNPLDVAVSFAYHSKISISEMIDRMCNPVNSFCDNQNRLHNQLRQKLLTWSGHVLSWVDESGLPVTVIRYEDMVLEPVSTFGEIIEAAGLEVDSRKLEKALNFSSFERLQAMEHHSGFKERPATAETFFRKGAVGDWRNILNVDQTTQLTSVHREVMRRFGYLSADGQPIF
jgi:aryl sulfotransferase